MRQEHCGGGIFFGYQIESLDEIIPFVTRRDQSLSTWGIASDELKTFAKRLNGKGLDRIIPFGQALLFDRYWDGYDLLQSFSRRINILS